MVITAHKPLKWRLTVADRDELEAWLRNQEWIEGVLKADDGLQFYCNDIPTEKFEIIRRAGWKFNGFDEASLRTYRGLSRFHIDPEQE